MTIFDAEADDRTAGERITATKTRNRALEAFSVTLARVWHYLSSATDDTDQWPELRRYGVNVRRERGPNKAATPAPTPTPQ